MSKKPIKLPKKPLYVITAMLIIGFALTVAGLFIDIGVQYAFIGFFIVIIGAVLKIRYYRCPYCGSFRAVRKSSVNFQSFNCPNCRKKIDFE